MVAAGQNEDATNVASVELHSLDGGGGGSRPVPECVLETLVDSPAAGAFKIYGTMSHYLKLNILSIINFNKTIFHTFRLFLSVGALGTVRNSALQRSATSRPAGCTLRWTFQCP